MSERDKLEKLREFTQQRPTVILKVPEQSLVLDFLGGMASGIISRAIMYPIENIQSYLALRTDYKAFKRREAYFSGIPQMMKEEGMMNIFRGIGSVSLRQGIHFGVDLMLFYQIKYAMSPQEHFLKKEISLKRNILSGMLASFLGYVALTPILEAGIRETGKSQSAAILETIKKQGIGSVYKFWKLDIPQAVIGRGLLIGLYEAKFKKLYYHMKGKVPYLMRFLDAYSFALFTGFVTSPLAIIKKRILRAMEEDPKGFIDIGMLFKTEGSKVFLKGISRIFLTQISPALCLVLFSTALEHRNYQEVPI